MELEPFNPHIRTEALRLLSKAHLRLGDYDAACRAAEHAATDAANAECWWLEMLALRDLLSVGMERLAKLDTGDLQKLHDEIVPTDMQMADATTREEMVRNILRTKRRANLAASTLERLPASFGRLRATAEELAPVLGADIAWAIAPDGQASAVFDTWSVEV